MNFQENFEKEMEEYSSDLNLEMGLSFVPKTISDILAQVSAIDDFSMKSSILDFYVTLIEEEMRKIDPFKRELPLCMHFLEEAIERLMEEKLKLKARETKPVMEEFIPLKSDPEMERRTKGSFEFSEKKNWMSSTQICTTPIRYERKTDAQNQDSTSFLRSMYEFGERSGSGKVFQGLNIRNRGGAFLPFKKPCEVVMKEETKNVPLFHGLSLTIPVDEMESIDMDLKDASGFKLKQPYNHQQQKKQRRCWSPDLHSKFIDALQLLGGEQVATPKQIREIMNVEGLTNDEVKSHLQKYRIHVRRVPVSSSFEGAAYKWLAQDEHIGMGGSSGRTGGLLVSPQGPLVHGGLSAKRGLGTDGESLEEDEDDKFEIPGLKGRAQKKRT